MALCVGIGGIFKLRMGRKKERGGQLRMLKNGIEACDIYVLHIWCFLDILLYERIRGVVWFVFVEAGAKV